MPSEAFFLDTNGWIALLNASDALHAIAERTWQQLARRGVTVFLTDWVLAETGNGLARTRARAAFAAAAQIVRTSNRVRLVFADQGLLDRALSLYADRPDKMWGLIDCASFVVMRDNGITDAFTMDRHFEQAGFRCLLPPQ